MADLIIAVVGLFFLVTAASFACLALSGVYSAAENLLSWLLRLGSHCFVGLRSGHDSLWKLIFRRAKGRS